MLPPIGHIGLLGGHATNNKRSIETRACNLAGGALYTYPTASTTLNATDPLTFKWDTSCELSSSIDLYLYAYAQNASSGLVQGWKGVDFSLGQYQVNLNPKWWNSTSAQLQFAIIEPSKPIWDPTSPPGPVFQVN